MPAALHAPLQDEMLPAIQMRQLYELHPREPWRVVYFPGGGSTGQEGGRAMLPTRLHSQEPPWGRLR